MATRKKSTTPKAKGTPLTPAEQTAILSNPKSDPVEVKKIQDLRRKAIEDNLAGKTFWCSQKEARIVAGVCEKMQSTGICSHPDCVHYQPELGKKSADRKARKKNSGPTKASYQTIMRAHFAENGMATLAELVDLVNSHPTRKDVKRPADAKNLSVGISILCNEKRTKNPMRISYSRKMKTYYNLDHPEMKKVMETGEAEYDKAKKADKPKDK